jgi:hypothetical protein
VARIIEIASDIPLPRWLLIHTDLQIGDEGGQNLLGTVSTVCGGCRGETVQTVAERCQTVPKHPAKARCE